MLDTMTNTRASSISDFPGYECTANVWTFAPKLGSFIEHGSIETSSVATPESADGAPTASTTEDALEAALGNGSPSFEAGAEHAARNRKTAVLMGERMPQGYAEPGFRVISGRVEWIQGMCILPMPSRVGR